jgi:hypothetical protein
VYLLPFLHSLHSLDQPVACFCMSHNALPAIRLQYQFYSIMNERDKTSREYLLEGVWPEETSVDAKAIFLLGNKSKGPLEWRNDDYLFGGMLNCDNAELTHCHPDSSSKRKAVCGGCNTVGERQRDVPLRPGRGDKAPPKATVLRRQQGAGRKAIPGRPVHDGGEGDSGQLVAGTGDEKV